MSDIEPQKADGKVLFHFTMSLDGFVAGPGHALDWMTGFTGRDGVEEEYIATTGAVLGGRDGWDLDPTARPYSADWQGPMFVLTHHPEDAVRAEGVTFLNCDVAEAIRIGLDAAAGKNLEILSPTIGRQALVRGLVDEIDLHIVPILLGDGVRVFDNPGGEPIRLRHAQGQHPVAEVDVRYHPVASA
jgi:dihydrofolate reductase